MKKYLLLFILAIMCAGSADAQSNTGAVYTYVEQMPVARYDANKYVSENLKYPKAAIDDHIQGRVIVKFIVNEDGSLSDAVIVRGIGSGCDEEAKRIIKSMPKWMPGQQNGVPVKTYYTMPILFTLHE